MVQRLALSIKRLQTQIVEEMCGLICRRFALRPLLRESCWCSRNLLLPEKYFFLKSTGKKLALNEFGEVYISAFSLYNNFVDPVCT